MIGIVEIAKMLDESKEKSTIERLLSGALETEEEIEETEVIASYVPPKFNLTEPDLEAKGAETKFRNRLSRYLAFIDVFKQRRSSQFCTRLTLACTSKRLIKIFGSRRGVNRAIHDLIDIGLLSVDDASYSFGHKRKESNWPMTYRYYVENERQLVAYCEREGIKRYVWTDELELDDRKKKALQSKCARACVSFRKKGVRFDGASVLRKPYGVGQDDFEKYLTLCLYENYPGLPRFQRLAKEINETYYTDCEDLKISFSPSFHWDDGMTQVRGIGIRACNRLCNAVVDDTKAKSSRRVLRQNVLDRYGLVFEQDIKSSVPRLTYAFNGGGWVGNDYDFYEAIYKEFDPADDFTSEKRDAVKKLFMRMYFDGSDRNMNHHIRLAIDDGAWREEITGVMSRLRAAMKKVLGGRLFGKTIFYFESCIYMEALEILLKKGYFVWLVYDGFYGRGAGTEEQFKKDVLDAVYASFVRFKMSDDFAIWDEIYKEDKDI